jgi:methyl-accepting chemotaxis protein
MDFLGAIKAHHDWKQKLAEYLAKPDGHLKATDVSFDHKCSLGEWIHGDGAAYAKFPEFSTLKTEHARFHKAASEVINKANSGQRVSAETALSGKSEFAVASGACVMAIMRMRGKVEG